MSIALYFLIKKLIIKALYFLIPFKIQYNKRVYNHSKDNNSVNLIRP